MGSLRQGDLASLELAQTIEDPGFWLPLSSLTESSRGLWSCYAAEPAEDGYQLARRELELLHQTETHAFVRGTLRDDELVVLEGLHRLTPGMPVTVTIAAQTHSQPFAQGEKDGTR